MFVFYLMANIVFNRIKVLSISVHIFIYILWMHIVHPRVDSYVYAFDAANACTPFTYKSV